MIRLPATWADPAEVAARILHGLTITDPKAGAEMLRGIRGSPANSAYSMTPLKER